jgi:2-polyprenyl-3-methyl-5-hydroxy-6-metoxy-1,4-benzoquinol methylase
MSSSPVFLDPVVLPLIRGECVLDVACGYGRWGCLLRTNYFDCGLSSPPMVDGLDVFVPNVEYVKKLGVYRDVWQAELPCEILKGKYTTILACEVLEHLPMDVVEKTLDELEAAAIQRVVVSTPNWKCLRDGSETFLGKNEYDHHLSYVSANFLRKRGYKIFGAGFGNPRTLSVKLMVHSSRLLGVRDFSIFDSLSKRWPSLAHTIVAVKDRAGR